MRASDADRDAVAARLREALAEGRLDAEEHSERLDIVLGAKTMGELVPVTHDLPEPAGSGARDAPAPISASTAARPVYGRERVGGEPTGYASLAVMGGSTRGGNWTVPKNYTAFALMGGIELDLREARFAERETTIYANTIMGGIGIIVPDDIEVQVSGIGIMGGYGQEATPSSVTEPGTPVVRVVGLAVMGGVGVERRPRQHQTKAQQKKLGHGNAE